MTLDPLLRELLDLVVRWIHVIAAIMWIGNSLLYNWLDRRLLPPDEPKVGGQGHAWLLHSGAFYYVEKTGMKGQGLPAPLHWFKWQAYTTWISGAALLILVYYMSGAALLIDPASGLSPAGGIGLSVGLLAGAFLVYEVLTRSPLMRSPLAGVLVGLALIAGLTWLLDGVFTTRATFLHIGATLGTLMASNVFLKIIPFQRQVVASVAKEGEADAALSSQAKIRSIHNNYMTFPVIILMMAGHFPSFHGHEWNWMVMILLVVGGAGVRHILNIRLTYRHWLPALLGLITATLVALYLLVSLPAAAAERAHAVDDDLREVPTFEEVHMIVTARCTTCHSQDPEDRRFGIAPGGVSFDRPDQIRALADRVHAQSVATHVMPPGNLTGMTQEERDVLRRWIRAGAPAE
jgi:uncharacterized membrane protein